MSSFCSLFEGGEPSFKGELFLSFLSGGEAFLWGVYYYSFLMEGYFEGEILKKYLLQGEGHFFFFFFFFF